MTAYKDLSKEELLELKSELEARFEEVKEKGLKLDMSRGKPAADQLNLSMDGLKDSVIQMLAGEGVRINTGTFSNDMTTFATKDDVLTLLVHLGYLTYNSETEKVTIPNKEVSQEYLNAISTMDWHEVMRSVENSRKLVEALWNQDAKAVAAGINYDKKTKTHTCVIEKVEL